MSATWNKETEFTVNINQQPKWPIKPPAGGGVSAGNFLWNYQPTRWNPFAKGIRIYIPRPLLSRKIPKARSTPKNANFRMLDFGSLFAAKSVVAKTTSSSRGQAGGFRIPNGQRGVTRR
jgi:hypothetical protein